MAEAEHFVEMPDVEPAPRRPATGNEAVAKEVRRFLPEADRAAAGAKLSG
jgi:hypothetical protein